MPGLTIIIGDQIIESSADNDALLGDVITHLELPLEQPCAGLGTCGKCKVLSEGGLASPDEIERKHLTEGELAVGTRLACRARISGEAKVVLAPIAVYSNKIFKASNRYKHQRDVPLGLAIDLGSTTVAAFLTMLDDGQVCVAGASLNQQSIYGADVISRIAAALGDEAHKERLQRLAISSINQAVDSLNLSVRIHDRIEKAVVVCNPAMHHLLVKLPVDSLGVMPFQPFNTGAIYNSTTLLDGILPGPVKVSFPPLIGGFVGSDALACLSYFGFDQATAPQLAVDLGTNGEIMLTDGDRILVASTAAGPAFEGVNISCGSRAVNGGVTKVSLDGDALLLETIGDEDPVGLTGSGLLSAIYTLRMAELIEPDGRINRGSALQKLVVDPGAGNMASISLAPMGNLRLSQMDIRELQKAKGAVRAAIDILMGDLELRPEELEKVILTGSFGGQVDVQSALGIGLLPTVAPQVVKNIPNGAGLGAASFLSEKGFERALLIAERAEHFDLDLNAQFFHRFIDALALIP
jgi:uncharacterized 2Fe-2S/4Fe-4S cluster protein (DUF4445 family)